MSEIIKQDQPNGKSEHQNGKEEGEIKPQLPKNAVDIFCNNYDFDEIVTLLVRKEHGLSDRLKKTRQHSHVVITAFTDYYKQGSSQWKLAKFGSPTQKQRYSRIYNESIYKQCCGMVNEHRRHQRIFYHTDVLAKGALLIYLICEERKIRLSSLDDDTWDRLFELALTCYLDWYSKTFLKKKKKGVQIPPLRTADKDADKFRQQIIDLYLKNTTPEQRKKAINKAYDDFKINTKTILLSRKPKRYQQNAKSNKERSAQLQQNQHRHFHFGPQAVQKQNPQLEKIREHEEKCLQLEKQLVYLNSMPFLFGENEELITDNTKDGPVLRTHDAELVKAQIKQTQKELEEQQRLLSQLYELYKNNKNLGPIQKHRLEEQKRLEKEKLTKKQLKSKIAIEKELHKRLYEQNLQEKLKQYKALCDISKKRAKTPPNGIKYALEQQEQPKYKDKYKNNIKKNFFERQKEWVEKRREKIFEQMMEKEQMDEQYFRKPKPNNNLRPKINNLIIKNNNLDKNIKNNNFDKKEALPNNGLNNKRLNLKFLNKAINYLGLNNTNSKDEKNQPFK